MLVFYSSCNDTRQGGSAIMPFGHEPVEGNGGVRTGKGLKEVGPADGHVGAVDVGEKRCGDDV